MTTPDTGDQPPARPLAPSETGLWAFLEYKAVWIPVLAFTLLLLIAAVTVPAARS